VGLGNDKEAFLKPYQHKATPKTLFVFSVPIVLIGDSPPPAVRIEALLGDKECNSAYAGGEVSAGFLND